MRRASFTGLVALAGIVLSHGCGPADCSPDSAVLAIEFPDSTAKSQTTRLLIEVHGDETHDSGISCAQLVGGGGTVHQMSKVRRETFDSPAPEGPYLLESCGSSTVYYVAAYESRDERLPFLEGCAEESDDSETVVVLSSAQN